MPRAKRPPHLIKKARESGAVYWIIKDGDRRIATGCLESDVEGADRALTEYKAEQYQPAGGSHPAAVSIADVLILYARDKGPENARPKELATMIRRLNDFWGKRTVIEIKGATCREYTRKRGAKIAARNELSMLRAAVNHWHAEHTLTAVPVVKLPAANPSRIRWLRRDEAAALLNSAWRARQTVKAGRTKRTSRPQTMTGGKTKRPTARHLARLILIGLYSGTRPGAILDLYWQPNVMGGWIDLERGVMYRAAEGAGETKKRKTPVRLPSSLLAHLRRWKRLDDALPPRADAAGNPLPRPVVHWHGEPVTKVHKAFRGVVKAAGLGPDVTPHVLRHTRATWLMQAGVDMWEAAGSLGMTVEMLETVYGHHHPDFQKQAAEAY